MQKHVVVPEKNFNLLKNFANAQSHEIINIKEFIKHSLNELINDDISNFTVYISNLENNSKIKVFSENYIYILVMTVKLNNKYTIWFKKRLTIV